MGNPRSDIRAIFDAGLQAADPGGAITRAVRCEGHYLKVGGGTYDLDAFDRVLVVGTGKAAASMAAALEHLLGERITAGFITTKYGYGTPLKTISITEAGHPLPDDAGIRGCRRILENLQGAGERDLILCVISGGGSALMPFPADGISLQAKQETTQALLDCGADIHEINTIRKHISGIKGGQLARAAFPATLVTLVLSDVIGDDLDVIASGPTVPDRSTFADCIAIMDRYGLADSFPPSVTTYLREGAAGGHPETPKPSDPVFERTGVSIIGSASLSLDAAQEKARALGYSAVILSSSIEGETRGAASFHVAVAREIQKSGNPVPVPACLISGGETTVTIHGDGLGGRNMEFVLAAAIVLDGCNGITVLSGGTDGTDGPTDAAGAVADGSTVRRARENGIDAVRCLENNDSYHFFEKIGDLLKTGPTMTNVMDLRVFLVTASGQ